jgi:hypothetical protein
LSVLHKRVAAVDVLKGEIHFHSSAPFLAELGLLSTHSLLIGTSRTKVQEDFRNKLR